MTSPTMPTLPAMPDRNFFGKLFDFSFKSFVTTDIIAVLYVLGVVLSGFWAVAIFLGFAARGAGYAILGVILAPLVFFVSILLGRVWMEILIVVFRIAESTEEMTRLLRQRQ